MQTTYSIFRSRTFWVLVAAGLIPVANLFVPVLPPALQAIVELILTALAGYFHADTATKIGASN